MAVPCTRNAPGRPERIPRGFVAHNVRRYRVAGLRCTGPRVYGARCAPLQGGGFAAHGSAFCGARCAPLQGWGLIPKGGCWGKRAARCLQPAETVAANIVRHGGSLREKRTGPAGTHPPRFCGARGAGLWRTLCAATGRGLIPKGRCSAGFRLHRLHPYRTFHQ